MSQKRHLNDGLKHDFILKQLIFSEKILFKAYFKSFFSNLKNKSLITDIISEKKYK